MCLPSTPEMCFGVQKVSPSQRPLNLTVPPEVKDILILKERPGGMRLVLQNGYAPDLHEKIGKDPFLIAAAMAGPDRVVVTREVSKPKLTRANRRVMSPYFAYSQRRSLTIS